MSFLLSVVVVFSLFLAHCAPVWAENTDRSKAEPVCSRSDVLFCENWEDGDSVGWEDFRRTAQTSGATFVWGGIGCVSGTCDFPGIAGLTSGKSLVARMAANTQDTIYPAGRFNSPVALNETVYYRYRVYWSSNFEFNVHANKNSYVVTDDDTWRVAFQARPQKDGSSVNITSAIPYIHLYGPDAFGNLGQSDVAPGSWQEAYAKESGGDVRYFPNQPGFENFRLQTGKWYTIEVMVKPNPMGQSFGGHLSAWIDDQLVIDYDNVSVRHANGATPLTKVWFNSYYGGGGQTTHPEQYVLFDDIVVSKNRIGSSVQPAPTPTPTPVPVKVFHVAPNGTYLTRPIKMLKNGAMVDPVVEVGTVCDPAVVFKNSTSEYHSVTVNGVTGLSACK